MLTLKTGFSAEQTYRCPDQHARLKPLFQFQISNFQHPFLCSNLIKGKSSCQLVWAANISSHDDDWQSADCWYNKGMQLYTREMMYTLDIHVCFADKLS